MVNREMDPLTIRGAEWLGNLSNSGSPRDRTLFFQTLDETDKLTDMERRRW